MYTVQDQSRLARHNGPVPLEAQSLLQALRARRMVDPVSSGR